MARGPWGVGIPLGRLLLPLLLLLSLARGAPRAWSQDGECGRGAGAALPRPWAGLARSPGVGLRSEIGRAGPRDTGGLSRLPSPPPHRGCGELSALRPGPRPPGTWREPGLGASRGWGRPLGEPRPAREGVEGRSACTVTLPAPLWLLRDKFLTLEQFSSCLLIFDI